MVQVAGGSDALRALKARFLRLLALVVLALVGLAVVYRMFTARVGPNEFGVEQVRFGMKTGIMDRRFDAGLYYTGPGQTMHTFPRGLHVLEASASHEAGRETATHRVVDPLNIQTSDGYAVSADVTLLYRITDPVRVAKDFGWGTLYVDSFVINTFRNGVLTTLGKINAESFYDEKTRIAAIQDAQDIVGKRFAERGFKVEKLLLRNYRYAQNYERSLHDKKVAVQLTEKNRKEGLVNEEKAKLQQIESKGNAAITIAESEVNAQIAKIRAEAELYSSQKRAEADTKVNVAAAEAKRLKAEALTQSGGRYVVALETMKMFENISGAVMTPEQYIAFVRNAWAVIGVSPGAAVPPAPAPAGR